MSHLILIFSSGFSNRFSLQWNRDIKQIRYTANSAIQWPWETRKIYSSVRKERNLYLWNNTGTIHILAQYSKTTENHKLCSSHQVWFWKVKMWLSWWLMRVHDCCGDYQGPKATNTFLPRTVHCGGWRLVEITVVGCYAYSTQLKIVIFLKMGFFGHC